MIGRGLYARLAGWAPLTALVGSRIHPLQSPEGTALPRVVLRVPQVTQTPLMAGYATVEEAEVEISCYARTVAEAVAVGQAVASAFARADGTWDGVVVQDSMVVRRGDAYEDDPGIMVHDVTIRCFYEATA